MICTASSQRMMTMKRTQYHYFFSKKGDDAWAIKKETLGWTFYSVNKTLELDKTKIQAFLATLQLWCRSHFVPFEEFQKVVGKL